MARQTGAIAPTGKARTPIPAPGSAETQNVVNQPEVNYPEPGTGPKQPGYTLSHEQMVGESTRSSRTGPCRPRRR